VVSAPEPGATARAGTAGTGRRPLGRLRAGWTEEAELAAAIHGTVVGSAVMVAASLHGTVLLVVVTVVATLLVYWATERYAELLAAGARGPGTGWRRVIAALRRGWPMLQSAYAPVIVLLVVSALGAELPVAVLAALGLSTLLLGGLGYEAARRSGNSGSRALWWSTLSALLGVIMILLKLVLH
jgi:hypothetical protein